ncbi:hypothetical protein Tco_0140529 [Tanacetum coccineum]
MKNWVEIIRENVFCLGGNQDPLTSCLGHMLYFIAIGEPYNLAFFVAKKIEFVRSRPRYILRYGMLLTHLFNLVMDEYLHLQGPQYLLFDIVMLSFGAPKQHKPRKDIGVKRSRHSTSSSSTFDHDSSSHQVDDDENVGDEGTS